MLEFKGGGFIKINNKKIEFTNVVDDEFRNFVKKKIRTNDVTEKITKVRFKLIDTAASPDKETGWITSDTGGSISRVGDDQLGVNFERGANEYHYVVNSDSGNLSKIEMEFFQEYGSDWIKAGNATFGNISYDANDYINEVEYHITISTPAGSLPEQKLVNRLLGGADVADSRVIPTKVRFKYGTIYGEAVPFTGAGVWSFGSGNACSLDPAFTQNIATGAHPIEYQLRTDDNETFDSGTITLNPPVGTGTGEVPWLPGDTIDFSYSTTVFN